MTHRQELHAPEAATSRPLSALQGDSGAPDAGARETAADAHTETLARGLATAAYLNPQRDTAPWGDLAEPERDVYRTEARRSTTTKESNRD